MKTSIPYGRGSLELDLPEGTTILKPPGKAPLQDPGAAILEKLASPTGTAPLAEIAQRRTGARTCIVVSDITRPVPYRILLPPILQVLESNGIARGDIEILVATGMHRPSTQAERVEMFGKDVCAGYKIVDHVSTEESCLVTLPERTSRGTSVSVNRDYASAGIKILTGLVEPHFMAGYSGGRKAVCPGLVNLATIQKFHGPDFLENPLAASGVLQGNPCHEEALEVARIAGADFIVNVTINLEREITGVFAGDLEEAFHEAVASVDAACRAEAQEEAEIVVTSGGGYPLDATLYQVVKGMVAALPVVKKDGVVLTVAECSEGIGSAEYKELMFEYSGRPDDFLRDIKSSPIVRKDQWELEMQCKVIARVGMGGLILCTTGIPREDLARMSLTPGYDFSEATDPQRMFQEVFHYIFQNAHPSPRVIVIPDGPYVLAGVKPPAEKYA